MEPNLEKLTRALVPAPMEETRRLMQYDLQTYMSDPKIPTTIHPFELAIRNIDDVERIQREQSTIIRQYGARAYAHQALKKGEYDKVVEVIKFAIEQPEKEADHRTGYKRFFAQGIIYRIARDKEIPHIEELLYELLNKGAWNELAKLRSKNRGFVEVPVLEIALGFKRLTEFDAAVRKRLAEVMPYLKDASIDEEKAYRQACEAFEYKEGQEAIVRVEADKVRRHRQDKLNLF